MPRIRTVKPQYWSTPDPPSRDARLLYIAMWNWADDEGIGTANPKELSAFAFPNDDDIGPGEVKVLLREISRSFHCLFYTVGGRPYYCIDNFRDHQVINKPTESKRPRPDEAEKVLYQGEWVTTGELPESSMDARGLERRNTGTQEHRNGTAVAVPSGESRYAEIVSNRPAVLEMAESKLNEASDLVLQTIPKGHPRTVVTRLRDETEELLKSGTDPDLIKEALALWLDKPHMGPGGLATLVSELIKRRTAKPQHRGADAKAMRYANRLETDAEPQ